MKKLIAFIFIALLSAVSFADTETVNGVTYTYSISNGEATIGNEGSTAISTSTSGLLVIPSKLGGYPVTTIGERAFSFCSSLTSVTIPESVTSIEDLAFYDCSSLKSVTFHGDRPELSDGAFESQPGDYKFTILIPYTNATWFTQGYQRYWNGHKVGYISNVESGPFRELVDGIEWNYYIVEGEAEIRGSSQSPSIPKDTSGKVVIPSVLGGCPVSRIGFCAFKGCSNVSEFVIPDTVKILDDECPFRDCVGLKSVSVPDSVVLIGAGAFDGCKNLLRVDIGNHVETIWRRAFAGCEKLRDIVLPASLKYIHAIAVEGCHLEGVVMLGSKPESVNESDIFGSDRSKVVVYANAEDDSWRYSYDWHGYLLALVPKEDLSRIADDLICRTVWLNASGGALDTYCIKRMVGDSLGELPIPYSDVMDFDGWRLSTNEQMSVSSDWIVEEDMFLRAAWKPHVFQVKFDTGIEGVTVDSMDVAYGEFIDLPIPEDLPGYRFLGWVDSEGVTQDPYGFYVCEDVVLTASWGFVEAIDDNDWAYIVDDGVAVLVSYAPNVEQVEIPAQLGGYDIVTIPNLYFADCSNLVSVVIPNNIQNIGDGAFARCVKLENVELPNALRSLGSRYNTSPLAFVQEEDLQWSYTNYVDQVSGDEFSVREYAYSAKFLSRGAGVFEECQNLKTIMLPEGLEIVGAGAFRNCKSLQELVFPDSVRSIGGYACESCVDNFICDRDSVVVRPNGVTMPNGGTEFRNEYTTRSCASGVCEGCSSLKQVSLPPNVAYLGPNAFKDCVSLMMISLPDSLTEIFHGTFSGCVGLSHVQLPRNLSVIGCMERFPSHVIGDAFVIGSNGAVKPSGGNVEIQYDDYETVKVVTGANGAVLPSRYIDKSAAWLTEEVDPRLWANKDDFLNDWQFWSLRNLLEYYGVDYSKSLLEWAAMRQRYYPGEAVLSGSTDGVFAGCVALREVEIPETVRRIGDFTFYDCCNLEKIRLPNGIAQLGHKVFGGECSIVDATMPLLDFVSPYELIDSHAYVTNLTLTCGKKFVTVCDEYFKVYAPEESKHIEEGYGLEYLDRVSQMQSLSSYIDNAWLSSGPLLEGFYRLKRLEMPREVECFDMFVGFYESRRLTDLILPTSLKRLGMLAFEGCSVKEVVLPETLESIAAHAFAESVFENVTFCGNAPKLESHDIFVGEDGWIDNDALESLVVNVYPGSTGWDICSDSVSLPEDLFWPTLAAKYKRRPIRYIDQPHNVGCGQYSYFDSQIGKVVSIPQSWLNEYGLLSADGKGYAVVANLKPANSRSLYESFVTGLNPVREEEKFVVNIDLVDGVPTVSWDPDLGGARAYTILGSTDLKTWTKVEEGRASDYNFFKVSVEMK